MIDQILKNELFLRYFPPLAGFLFIALFVSLGLWQMDRAAEKEGLLELFETGGSYSEPADFGSLEEFDRIEVFGRYLPDRQVLIDNIPRQGRIGYFVITPFEPSTNDPLLLVNRGWVPKPGHVDELPDLDTDTEFGSVTGLVGRLPRVAIRPGEAFAIRGDWPRVALYPTIDEVAAELDQEILPVVLLLSPESDNGFDRQWQPNVSGPSTHYGYAFQWFAMALAVTAILGWHLKKRLNK